MTQNHRSNIFIVVAALLVFAARPAGAGDLPARPAEAGVLDRAGVITPEDVAAIAARQTEAAGRSPIFVATIESLATYDSTDIEALAARWFESWKLDSNAVLVIVSPADRKARIQLGARWGHELDRDARRIMNTEMIPAFKAGDYSRGVRVGVTEIARLTETGPTQAPESSLWWIPLVVIGGMFAIPLIILVAASGSSGGSSGGSGGSDGGGWSSSSSDFGSSSSFDSGGGATGSW